MILGGIAANSGFSADEIEGFDAPRARWWWSALAAYHTKAREAADSK